MTTFALVGVGKLGEALLSGMLRAGTPPENIIGAERYEGRAREIEHPFRETVCTSHDRVEG